MYLKLRILFTLLAVACAVALFPIGTFLGFPAAILCIMVGALFAGLMYLCKQKQEEIEAKAQSKNLDASANQTENNPDNPENKN